MNDQLKQRLVGAIVLVSLAVIFIPMILPGGGRSLHGNNVPDEPDYRFPPPKEAPQAPPKPSAPVVPIGATAGKSTKDVAVNNTKEQTAGTEAKVQGVTANKTTSNKSTEAADKKPAEVKRTATTGTGSVKPEEIKPGQVSAWIVQVGSFSSEPNAIALRDKLRKMGFASFVEAVKSEKGMVYRVRVGPELTRTLAEKLQKQLVKKAKLSGLVQAYP